MKTKYLKTLREQQGLTQEQLERLANVAQNTISRLESTSKVKPIYTTVVALADALGVDPRQLRFGPDPRRGPAAHRQKVEALYE